MDGLKRGSAAIVGVAESDLGHVVLLVQAAPGSGSRSAQADVSSGRIWDAGFTVTRPSGTGRTSVARLHVAFR